MLCRRREHPPRTRHCCPRPSVGQARDTLIHGEAGERNLKVHPQVHLDHMAVLQKKRPPPRFFILNGQKVSGHAEPRMLLTDFSS